MITKLLGANAFAKLMTAFFTVFFAVFSVRAGINEEPPAVPEDFTPVLRFAVCSDVHLNGDENQKEAKEFRELFAQCYEYSKKSEKYKNLDAVMVCGDMTDWGREIEYQSFEKIVSESLKEGTELLACMGNHEFIEERETEGVDAFANYAEYINEEFDTHTVINGYHFIGISYADKDENFGEKTEWLKEQLDIAVADTGNKPIFVFQHPHPALSVYGSINWADLKIRRVLSDYKQVVDFSGHSHYAPNDPRSIWQGKFTAIGTGAITGLIGNINYLDGGAGTTIPSASYHIIEVDADGNIRVQIFDAHNDVFFEGCDYYLEGVHNSKNHLYTWCNMKSLDTKPAFPENAEIKSTSNEQGETLISFPDAKGRFDAVSYNVTVKNSDGDAVYASSELSGYVTAVDDGISVNLGVLPEGQYTVRVRPVSPYTKIGKVLEGSFEVTK